MNGPKKIAFVTFCAALKTGLGLVETMGAKTRTSKQDAHESPRPGRNTEVIPSSADDRTPGES